MRKLGFAIGLVAMCCLVASAGTLQVKQLHNPVKATPAVTQAQAPIQVAPTDRVWALQELPPLDFVTGQPVSGGTRANTVVFDNSVNSIGSFTHFETGAIIGDDFEMIDGGLLKQIKCSVVNGDSTNTLASFKIKLCVLNGHYPPTLVTSVTSGTITPSTPLPYANGLLLTFDVSSANITVPAMTYLGIEVVDPTGTPANPTSFGPVIYDPPVVGVSFDVFFYWGADGTGTYTLYYFGGSPHADFYWETEVDPVAGWPTTPPVYDNTAWPPTFVSSDVAEQLWQDDLLMAPSTGQYLDSIDFTVWNGSTADTLNSVDIDIVLQQWAPGSGVFYPESDPDINHAVTFALTNAALGLPAGYIGAFYIDGLSAYNISLEQFIIAGLRFRNMSPASVTEVGQGFNVPPAALGYSEDEFIINGGEGWWFGGDPYYSNLYWGINIVHNPGLPCASKGDMNCDGAINSQDIDGFIYALFSKATQYDTYLHSFPVYHACDMLCADMNGDGSVNSQDIDGFIAALFGH